MRELLSQAVSRQRGQRSFCQSWRLTLRIETPHPLVSPVLPAYPHFAPLTCKACAPAEPQRVSYITEEDPVPAKAHCQLTVRYYECDPLGHVNHAMYVHYFEVGRLQAMAEAGLPFADVMQQGYTVVASDIYVQ